MTAGTPSDGAVHESYNTKVADVAEALDAGWRPDPTGRYEWRYWDGGWTNRVASSRPAAPGAAEPAAEQPLPAIEAPVTSLRSEPAAPAPSEAAATAAPIPVPWEPDHPTADPASSPGRKGALVKRAWVAFIGFFKSFVNQPESYHSERAVDISHDPRGERMLVPSPANYGRAGLVALSACGVAVGSYLPWLSGTIDGIPFQQTGFEDGHGWSFTIGAFALVCAALLAVRLHPLRWVAVGIAVALAGLTFRDLVHAHDVVTTMNTSATIEADVGTGLWIMAGCSVVALIASFRLGERE